MLLDLTISAILLSFLLSIWATRNDIPIVLMLAVSSLYYCIGGLWYWINARNSIFVGVSWEQSYLIESAAIISTSTFLLSFCIVILSKTRTSAVVRSMPREVTPTCDHSQHSLIYWAFLTLGVTASLFVLAKSSFSGGADRSTRGPLFLIAYQLSDILIAIAAYRVARNGFNAGTIALITYFVLYATLVGFRYKIALLFIPIILLIIFSPIPMRRKISVAAIGSLTIIALFSAMTLFRVKFGAPDLTRRIENPIQSILYGFFAETNVLFGMHTIVQNNIRAGDLHPFQPLIDTGAELLPRAIFSDRATGGYLRQMQLGFLTDQGMKSGTAYPWVGEFCIMFGWAGIVIAPLVMATIYEAIVRLLARSSAGSRYYFMGIFLFAGILGYYHFSRGYMPQIFKCYLFVMAPFIILSIKSNRRRTPVWRGAAAARGGA
ncbi:hypothetical protein [Caulobacter sp. SSI4214]|uniref:hypothetical protein n=1 Tax=Caulobacter sp. SSI4214 TaxID=2575739 RepID=UPI00143A5C9A|nr:hypothetical protein [Caulobacter sp. SSI4214]